MPVILLSRGLCTLVDPDDFADLMKHKWFAMVGVRTYAARMSSRSDGPRKMILMHRVIMQPLEGIDVDHINGDVLDNRRANLRLATRSQNLGNVRRLRAGITSRFKGVFFDTRTNRWVAKCADRWLRRHLTEEGAARAYDDAALEIWGEYAALNFPKPKE